MESSGLPIGKLSSPKDGQEKWNKGIPKQLFRRKFCIRHDLDQNCCQFYININGFIFIYRRGQLLLNRKNAPIQ